MLAILLTNWRVCLMFLRISGILGYVFSLYGKIDRIILNARKFDINIKSKEADFVGFITKIHISINVDQIFMFFMLKNSQHSVVLKFIFVFNKNRSFY